MSDDWLDPDDWPHTPTIATWEHITGPAGLVHPWSVDTGHLHNLLDDYAETVDRLIAHIARLEGVDIQTARLKHLGDQ